MPGYAMRVERLDPGQVLVIRSSVLLGRRTAGFSAAPAQAARRCRQPTGGCRTSRGSLHPGRGTPAARRAGGGSERSGRVCRRTSGDRARAAACIAGRSTGSVPIAWASLPEGSGAYCLCRRTAFAVVAAATVPSALVTKYRGSLVAGCLSNDSGATSRSRWNAVTPACGDRLNTTRLVPMPKRDRSIRNT